MGHANSAGQRTGSASRSCCAPRQLTPDARGSLYRWEFTENGRGCSVDVRARVLTNDPALNIRLVRSNS